MRNDGAQQLGKKAKLNRPLFSQSVQRTTSGPRSGTLPQAACTRSSWSPNGRQNCPTVLGNGVPTVGVPVYGAGAEPEHPRSDGSEFQRAGNTGRRKGKPVQRTMVLVVLFSPAMRGWIALRRLQRLR